MDQDELQNKINDLELKTICKDQVQTLCPLGLGLEILGKFLTISRISQQFD